MKEVELVIFDWDGTLVSSIDHITSSLSYAAAQLDLPGKPASELKQVIGLGMKEAIEVIYPGLSSLVVDSFRSHYADYFFRKPTSASDFFPGALPFVKKLKARGCQLAIATGKSRHGMERALDSTGVRTLFDYSRCADESASKPDPKMLFEVLAQFSVPPEKAVMIGDTVYDIEMSLRAGIKPIAVTFGVHGASDFEQFEGVALVNGYSEMSEIFCIDG